MMLIVFGLLTVAGVAIASPKIVIVGAGVSGLAAASHLIDNGLTDVTILEAESYVGGRVRSIKHDEGFLELGAQWIMGEEGNAAYAIAKINNIIGSAIDENTIFCFTSSGDRIAQQRVLDDWTKYDAIEARLRNSTKRVDTFFEEEILKIAANDNEKIILQKMFKMIFESITPVTRWNNEVGTGYTSFHAISGSTAISVKGGMTKLIDSLMVSRFGMIMTIAMESRINEMYYPDSFDVSFSERTQGAVANHAEAKHQGADNQLGT